MLNLSSCNESNPLEFNWDANDNGIGFMARYWQEALKISKAADDLWGIIPPQLQMQFI